MQLQLSPLYEVHCRYMEKVQFGACDKRGRLIAKKIETDEADQARV